MICCTWQHNVRHANEQTATMQAVPVPCTSCLAVICYICCPATLSRLTCPAVLQAIERVEQVLGSKLLHEYKLPKLKYKATPAAAQ
jgi:hypothetical protein